MSKSSYISAHTVLTLPSVVMIYSVTSVLTLERSHTLVRNVGGAFLSLQLSIVTCVVNIHQTNDIMTSSLSYHDCNEETSSTTLLYVSLSDHSHNVHYIIIHC